MIKQKLSRNSLLLALLLIATGAFASTAQADFHIVNFSGGLFNQDGTSYTQAGGHPYAAKATVELSALDFFQLEEEVKDIEVDLPPGFIGNPSITPDRCTAEQLNPPDYPLPKCPVSAQIGVVDIGRAGGPDSTVFVDGFPIYNMVPPAGYPAMFGFSFGGVFPILLLPKVRSDEDYGISIFVPNITQGNFINGSKVTFWGVPADPSHDEERGYPHDAGLQDGAFACASVEEFCSNSAGYPPVPFITQPTNCSADPLASRIRTHSWQDPGDFKTASFDHDTNGTPITPTGCEHVPVSPSISAAVSTDQAETPSGLTVDVDVPDDGLLNPDGIAQAHIKKAVATLPEGVTLNPSAAEGLGVCSPAQYAAETKDSRSGVGCPNNSRLGSVQIESPLLKEQLEGSTYLAAQDDPSTPAKGAENPFDSLLAIYIVVKNPERGISIKLAGELRTNEKTGRIEVEFNNLPQVPFTNFHFRFREGARAPLVTPPACGTYETKVVFTPWSDSNREVVSTSSFQITKGVGGGPCPKAGIPGFNPGFIAGSINNNAGAHTPFNMRLMRNDGEQNMTRFSAILPPGVLGKLAGIDKCPNSAIGVAKSKTGRQEIRSPSCPANSEIGHTQVGAGVGSLLTYVPGKIYLGGPFHGDPLSVIAITPVVSGPFDIGTVVVQEALTLNPKTAEVEVDGEASDPIPHILEGIPAKLRDLRVYVDRENFILNPTNCDASSAKATLYGSYLDVFSPADDVPVSLADRFQAASCQSLGFKPKLNLNLKGGTKRGGHPGLKATYKPRAKDANVKGLVVRLPRSAFLDQAHIRTICTRVQFAVDACPKAAQYGYIKAWTPLLEEPLQGPVWLRSSNHKLPDLVFDLHGIVDVEVATRIDSARGGIRATVEDAPDAPLSKVELRMQGGKKGLIINSRNLCDAISRANVEFAGHNGKEAKANPVMRADCGGKRKRAR